MNWTVAFLVERKDGCSLFVAYIFVFDDLADLYAGFGLVDAKAVMHLAFCNGCLMQLCAFAFLFDVTELAVVSCVAISHRLMNLKLCIMARH